MSDPRILSDRRQALEEAFFAKAEAAKLAELKSKLQAQKTLEELRAVSGIEDEKVLRKLQSLGVTGQDVAALSIIPILWVAWCDDELEESEREAVLTAAHQRGISKGSHAHQVLDHWLEENPGVALFEAWKSYAGTLIESMSDQEIEPLRASLVGLARSVAAAAGGILGINKVSAAEKAVLEDIENALTP